MQFSFLHHFSQFQVIFSFHCILYCTIACQYSFIGSCKLPYNDFFLKHLACGFWMSPANNISPMGKTGLHSNTMCYNRQYIVSHIGEIGIVWVWFFLLASRVGDIQYPKCNLKLHRVGVVMINNRINWLLVLWWFRRWVQLEHCSCQSGCCMVTLSQCHCGHPVTH